MSTKVQSDLDLQGVAKIINAPTPTSSTDLVNRQYVDDKFGGLNWKDDVRVAPTGNVNIASPGATHDGVTLLVGDDNKRMLLMFQTDPKENGIYDWNGAAVPMTRSDDANLGKELINATISVSEGSTNGSTRWRQTASAITIGSTDITFQSDNATVPQATETISGKAEI